MQAIRAAFGDRADEHRRPAALDGPAEPVSQFGACEGEVIHSVMHLPFS